MRLKSYRFLVCLVLLCIFIPYSALASLSVTFLDAGAGSAVLLQADGQTMLLNAGAETDGDVLLNSLADFDIPKIDLLASTLLREDDTDWIGAVLNKYETGSLWLPGTQTGEQTDDQELEDMQSYEVEDVTPEPGEQTDDQELEDMQSYGVEDVTPEPGEQTDDQALEDIQPSGVNDVTPEPGEQTDDQALEDMQFYGVEVETPAPGEQTDDQELEDMQSYGVEVETPAPGEQTDDQALEDMQSTWVEVETPAPGEETDDQALEDMQSYGVEVETPVPGEQTDDQELEDIQSYVEKAVTPAPGEQMDVGKAKVTVVKFNGQADGAASYLALRVTYDGHSFLFLPDTNALGEGADLESGADLHADVLSVGGEGILPPAILDDVSPLWMVVAGEVQADALTGLQSSGINVLQPGEEGVVTFTSDGTTLQEEHEDTGVVIQSSVNLRKEASTKAGKVATLAKGTKVDILGTEKGDEGLWYHIEADGKVGFVRGDLIEEASEEEADNLLTEATPEPNQSNSGTQDSGSGDETLEEAPTDLN